MLHVYVATVGYHPVHVCVATVGYHPVHVYVATVGYHPVHVCVATVGYHPVHVQIFELVREKYTGKRIIRHGSMFSSHWFSGDHGGDHSRRVSSQSSSSSSMVETHRRMPQTEASTSSSGNPSSSSVDEGSWKMTPRPLTPLKEEAAESMPGESDDKKTSYDVTQASSGGEEFFGPPHHLSDSRRPSILKLLPSNRSPENKRALHHVQFNEAQQLT